MSFSRKIAVPLVLLALVPLASQRAYGAPPPRPASRTVVVKPLPGDPMGSGTLLLSALGVC